MAIQSSAEIDAELQVWYAARTAAAAGKSFTLVTSAGTRTLTTQDLNQINEMIETLERKLSAPANSSGHSFALANFNNEAQR